MKKHIFLPFLFIGVLWIFFSFPYLLQNKVPYPSTYQVNFFTPWSANQKYWGPVKNSAMPDIITQIYPWKFLSFQIYQIGEIPFWNPYNFSGNPHLANFQTAVFSPFTILFFILPFIDAWSIVVLLQPLLAGIFTYCYLRSLHISVVGSLIGSISYMFCGFIVVWMAYGTLSMVVVFLPFILWGIERFNIKQTIWNSLLISFGIAIAFFSGHFQMSLYVFIFAFLYGIFRFYDSKKLLFLFLIAFCIGIIISLVQLIPSIEFYLHSVRSNIFIKEGGIPFYYLITLFAPDFYGNPVTRNDWVGNYAEWASFVGIVPFVLSFIALQGEKRREILFFTAASLVIILLALDTPFQQLLGQLKIPVISTSNPSRVIVLFSFSIAILSGFGLDTLMNQLKKGSTKRLFLPVLLLLGVLIGIWVLLFVGNGMTQDNILLAKKNLILPTILLISFIGTIFIAKLIKNKFIILVFPFFLLLVVSFDSFRFAQKWMPFDPKELVFPDAEVISAIKKNIGYGRIFGNLGTEVNTYYGISSIEGYDPLYIGRYGEFLRSSYDGTFVEAERSVAKIDRHGKYTDRVLNLLGVNLIFHPVADTNKVWGYPVWKNPTNFTAVYETPLFQIFKNKSSLERVTLFYDYEVITEKKEIIKRFYADSFDYKNTLILEEKIPMSKTKNNTNIGKATIVKYSPNFVEVSVTSPQQALLFLSDNYYPRWKAAVNGKESRILRADYTFRAVEVPKGDSTVTFYFSLL